MKRCFFQVAVVPILLYGCTTLTLTKRLKKKLDVNYTRMLQAILNRSWRQHPTRHQLYGHLPSITKTIQGRRTRHTGHCCDVLLSTATYNREKSGGPARTYIQQLCEDRPEAMNDWEKWRERVRNIRARGTRWEWGWWWWWWWYMPTIITIVKLILIVRSAVAHMWQIKLSIVHFSLFLLLSISMPLSFTLTQTHKHKRTYMYMCKNIYTLTYTHKKVYKYHLAVCYIYR